MTRSRWSWLFASLACASSVALAPATAWSGTSQPAATAPPPSSTPPVPATPPAPSAADARPAELVAVEVVARHPHDPDAFTQGLLVHDGHLYESTGREGRSEIRRVDIASGRVLARNRVPEEQFGEGLALWRDQLISLTWQHGVAHRWSLRSLRRVEGDFRYSGEGWGLATTADGLVMSDGTDALRFLNGDDFSERRRVHVTFNGRPLRDLNELEVVDGQIFANVWMTPFIVVIAPDSGVVTHVLDLRAIAEEVGARDENAVLNGIAFDPRSRRLFVTGKLWPTLFEIRLPDLHPSAATPP